jgi:hypothetical protein
MMFTVLVTGSRYWPDGALVAAELDRVWRALPEDNRKLLVRHGDAQGADRYAGTWVNLMRARGHEVYAEPHPADWYMHGRAAGPIRNGEMVEAGADVVLAFIHDRSAGATDCGRRARRAGLNVELFPSGTTPGDWLDG